jgi:ABC-2 type transport system permease protein
MNKLFAVFKREYFAAVRKKMFIIMTFLLPVLMAALFILPSMLMVKGMGQKKIVVVDGTGKLQQAFARPNAPTKDEKEAAKRPMSRRSQMPSNMTVEYVNREGDPAINESAKPYLDRVTMKDKGLQLDGVLVIPSDALTSPDAKLKYYGRSSTDFITQERLGSIVNGAVQRIRLAGRGLESNDIDFIMSRMEVEATQISKTGTEKKGGAGNFFLGFIFAALLVMPSFVYGLEIMRGIIQEKTDRVVEVLVSSMSPSQLLVGKILGVAAVGLTQISVWILMGAIAGAFGAATAAMAGVSLSQYLSFGVFAYFFIFFILAYLTYVCIYAIGGAVCNSDKEAQQLIAPFTMIMMLPWFLMAAIITNPDSTLSVAFSLAPVFGPLTMFVRTLVSEPPMWHIVVSIVVSIATILVFFWATAKIFRIGILSYGKRPTIPEIWRWMKVA